MGRISSIVSAGYAGAAIATMDSRGRRFERVRASPPRLPRPQPRAQDRPAGWRRFGRGCRDPDAALELELDAVSKRDRRRLRNIRIHHHHEETP